MGARRRGGGAVDTGMEANMMDMLDTAGFKISHHLNDDRISFLEAVRSASLLSDDGSAPTNKMFKAIFDILKDEDSLELVMVSHQLLCELDEHFPRVYLSKRGASESSSPSNTLSELVVVEEAWSPFTFGTDVGYGQKEESDKWSGGSVDPLGFHALLQEIAKMSIERDSQLSENKFLRNMLVLQYLVTVLEGDFSPRSGIYKENANWTLLREALLSLLLGSRKIIYKGLIKDCMSIISNMSCNQDEALQCTISQGSTSMELPKYDVAVALVLSEVKKSTCIALKKLLMMIMELDLYRKDADLQGLTTRADAVRTPALEIILDELTYNTDILFSFFQGFDEPGWKLKIVVQYFHKYIGKSPIRTRRSSGSVSDETFDGILKRLSNRNTAKSIIKKISSEVIQLLLGLGFEAYLSMPLLHSSESGSSPAEEVKGSKLVEVCKNVISTFTRLKKEDEETGLLPFGKEALFTAATIISKKS